uniref:Aminotransferase-like plant mobile domain-containing protein n=1 Tax=Fagus sylvatica TaxID=28930 RepID=A0A2N9FVJ1_FAGSY
MLTRAYLNHVRGNCKSTQFGWLLNLHCNIEASGRMLEVMVASWNVDKHAFQVGDRLIPFTLYDVALILGLPVRGEPIDCNQSHFGGSLVEKLLNTYLKTTSPEHAKLVTLLTKPSIKVPDRICMGKAVHEFLVSGLNHAAASKQSKKGRGNLHIQGCTALLQIWACEHLGIAMETLQETHGSSHTDILGNDGAGPSNKTQTPSNQWQLELQAEVTKREAVERHVKCLEDELNRVKGLVGTCSPSKAVKRGKPAKKKATAVMVDLASSPSKRDNEGEAAAAVVDLVSSPSKGATTMRYTRAAKTRAQKKVQIVSPQSEPVRIEWVDAHFLYQPTADDEAVLADFRKKWSFATRRATRRRSSGVDTNEVAISTETYEITGQDVSSLLGDQAQDESSRWISTVVVDTFKDVLMEKLTESGHPPPYINFIINVHGGTTILGLAQSTSTQRGKRTRKGKQPVQDDQPGPESVFRPSWVRAMPRNCNRRKALEQICIEKLGHQDVHTWLLEYKNDIPKQDKYALIAQEFGNAFCWNSITIPCCPKLYKAKTGQFFTVFVAAQFFTGI